MEDKLGRNALYMGCEAGHEHIVKVFDNFCAIFPFRSETFCDLAVQLQFMKARLFGGTETKFMYSAIA